MPEEINPQNVADEIRRTVDKLRADVADLEKKLGSFDKRISRQSEDALRHIAKTLEQAAKLPNESP